MADVILEEATGLSADDWEKTQAEQTDKGEKSHLLSKGAVRTTITVVALGKLIAKLPKMADDLAVKMKKAKVKIKTFVDNPFDEIGNLKPNVRFKTREFEYFGETDELGRLESMTTTDLKLTEREKRLRHNPKTPGKKLGDHSGHLFADRFGGSPELDNLVSQLSSVNLKTYKYHENLWADAIDAGAKVEVNIKVIYEGSDIRPNGFKLNYKINDEIFDIEVISNN